MNRASDQDSSALRRSAQAVERAAQKLEKTAEKLSAVKGDELGQKDGELDERLNDFEEGLTETLAGVTRDLFGELKNGLDGLVSGIFGLFSQLSFSKLGFIGELFNLVLPFAEGGFVNKPTLALLGETGPEYVIPEASLSSALTGGLSGIVDLLGDVRRGTNAGGGEWTAPAAGTVTTIQHIHNAPVVGSLDKLDEYSRYATAGHDRGTY